MADYIDREELLVRREERLNGLKELYGEYDAYTNGFDEGCVAVDDAPTVDAVPVVRCKDCKYCLVDNSGRENHLCMRKERGFVVGRKLDDFCSYGERKQDG